MRALQNPVEVISRCPQTPDDIQQRTQRSEEPPVLATLVSLVQCLLHSLLSLLPLRNLLECVVRHNVLESLELQSVTCGHQVVVVDDLDEGLHL